MRHRTAILALTALFGASRVAAYAAGIRFDAGPLGWYWQYLDPLLLQQRLLESLVYSPAQPPLFNLLLGLTLKLFPGTVSTAFYIEFLITGWLALVGIFVLLTRLGVPVRISAILGGLWTISPASLLYENWLFYEYLTMTLLVWAAVALHRFVADSSRRWGVAFFALSAALMCTRSMFQIVWLLPIVALLMWRLPPRLVLRCSAIPLLAIAAVYGKNIVLFGGPTTSSWLGMHLARGSVAQLDPVERARLVADGTLHGVSAIVPFSRIESYAGLFPPSPATGIPVLDMPAKTGGNPNYHAAAYLPVAREYLEDATWVLRHRPGTYLHTVYGSVLVFFGPSTRFWPLDTNRERIRGYEDAVSRWIYVSTPILRRLGFGILAAYLVAGTFAGAILASLARTRTAPDARACALLFMAFTCAYVFAASVLVESGENHRMRFVLDPLVLAIVASGVARYLRARA
ncbi:MAG: hypothetical protein M3Q55_02245 [Acidobacteriota bacterium]|nr:hypothetical protein [Acidobacteriota bacterium]